jgi:hypothetical protein
MPASASAGHQGVQLAVLRESSQGLLREGEGSIHGDLEHTTGAPHELHPGTGTALEAFPHTEGFLLVASGTAVLDLHLHGDVIHGVSTAKD